MTDGLGNRIEFVLDTEGNVVEKKVHDATGALRRRVSRTFDLYNRLDVLKQENETRDLDYAPDGTLTRETDGRGVVTEHTYDALRRLVETIQDAGSLSPETASSRIRYEYDVHDNLASVTNAEGARTTYIYDDLGNRLTRNSPDTGVTTYRYDEAGNLIERVDAKGQVFRYTYDASNRLTSVDGPGTDSDITYTYDDCPGGVGRLCRIVRGDVTLEYEYNAFGEVTRIRQEVVTWPGYQTAVVETEYEYDATGRLSAITYPSGMRIEFSRDAAGGIRSIDMNDNGLMESLVSSAVHHPFGHLQSAVFGNGETFFEWRDSAGRPAWRYSGPYQQWINPYSDYDEAGNLLGYGGTETASFGYDPLDRLVQASAAAFGSREYAYDRNGNRLALYTDDGTVTYAYASASNRLSAISGAPVSQDANGNTLTWHGLALSFTADNRLRAVAGRARYAYAGSGARALKEVRMPGPAGIYGYYRKRLYFYGSQGRLLAEFGPTGQVLREYVYFDDLPVAVIDRVPEAANDPLYAADRDGDGAIGVEDFLEWYFNEFSQDAASADVTGDGVTDWQDIMAVWHCAEVQNSCAVASYHRAIYYIHTDHLGTPKMLTDESGTTVWKATHLPFGEAAVDEDPDGDGAKVTFNLRFPGQYYDAETGLHYNYYRYYDSSTGRYLESDLVGLSGGLNTYAYVGGNPLRYTDPQGLHHDGLGCVDPRGNRVSCPRNVCANANCGAGLPPVSEPGACSKCRVGCVLDFLNPIPGIGIERGARAAGRKFGDVAGEIATDIAKKVNKVKGAFDLGQCLDRCRKACEDKHCNDP